MYHASSYPPPPRTLYAPISVTRASKDVKSSLSISTTSSAERSVDSRENSQISTARGREGG